MSLVTAIKTYKTPYALKAEELRELVGAPLSLRLSFTQPFC